MKRLIVISFIALAYTCLGFGQAPNNTEVQGASIQDSPFIEVYVDKKGNIFFDKKKTSLMDLEKFLIGTDLKKAKFATVFPTPMKVFATVEQVDNLFKKYSIEAAWFKDPEFSIPAWK